MVASKGFGGLNPARGETFLTRGEGCLGCSLRDASRISARPRERDGNTSGQPRISFRGRPNSILAMRDVYQSDPRTLPSLGVQALVQVVAVMFAARLRTLPSHRPVIMLPV